MKAFFFNRITVAYPYHFNAVQQFNDWAVHRGFGVQQLNTDTFLRADLPCDNPNSNGDHEQGKQCQIDRQGRKYDDNSSDTIENCWGKVHENQFFQFNRPLKATV